MFVLTLMVDVTHFKALLILHKYKQPLPLNASDTQLFFYPRGILKAAACLNHCSWVSVPPLSAVSAAIQEDGVSMAWHTSGSRSISQPAMALMPRACLTFMPVSRHEGYQILLALNVNSLLISMLMRGIAWHTQMQTRRPSP